MPGTIVFKPIEANLLHNTDIVTKMNPYCAFIIGGNRINSHISKHGGKHPHWNDAITVPFHNEPQATVQLMDKDRFTNDDHIGSCTVDLSGIQAQGHVSKWYPLYYKNKPAGEILLETSLQNHDLFGQKDKSLAQSGVVYKEQQKETINNTQSVEVVEKEKLAGFKEKPIKTFVEQRQTVEEHTFMKEIDVVETRPVQQMIEVFEPRKVLKEVQYTEIVPVKKMIETIEPQVVTKEIEVMEPMIITKTIQVIENFPVKKQIEVIESVPTVKEVETYEPQTFTRQVEIIEHVPVTKSVTVTEPVHVKKAVEFVEPIITTKTITKEIRPEVIVNQQVTKSVGPATYVGEMNESRRSQVLFSETEKVKREVSGDQDNGLYQSQSQDILSRKVVDYAGDMKPSQSQRSPLHNNRF